MKRNIIIFFLSLVLLLALATPAAADIMWEPFGNNYFESHRQEMDRIDQTYLVPEGMTVNLYESPSGGRLLDTLDAGTRIYIGFSKELGGEVWAVGYPIGDYKDEGWCRLGRLQLEYDSRAFSEDFGDQFTDYEGQMDGYEVTEQIYVWTYPGSGILQGTISEIHPDYNDGKLECQAVYTDPAGGEWGYVGYYMGHRDWIYLSDPENPNPPTFPQAPENTVTDTSPTEEAPETSPSLYWVIGLVAGVAAVTGILIWRMKKRAA